MEDIQKQVSRTKPEPSSPLITKEEEERENKPKNGQIFEGNWLEIEVKKLNQHYESGFIGDNRTLLAFKDLNNYAIGTSDGGFAVVEDSLEIHSDRPPGHFGGELRDIVYIAYLNCYLFNHEDQIYRKDINQSPAYLYLPICSESRVGACFGYSKLNQKLIIPSLDAKISVIDLNRERLEFQISAKIGQIGSIRDLRIFGSSENRIIFITRKGWICIYYLNYSLRKVIGHHRSRIEGVRGETEEGYALSVSENNRYILASLITSVVDRRSRLFLYEIRSHSLLKLAVLEDKSCGIGIQGALEFWGRVGAHFLWVGLSERVGFVQLFDFDAESGELKELAQKSVSHQEFSPRKMCRLGNNFYFTGGDAKIMQLSFNL